MSRYLHSPSRSLHLQKQRFQGWEPSWGLWGAPSLKGPASEGREGTGGQAALTIASEPWPPSDVGKRTSRTESREILPRTMSSAPRGLPTLRDTLCTEARARAHAHVQSPARWTLIGRAATRPRSRTWRTQ